MAENTTIEWCDHTFSPWIGCTKVSPACDNCYAANYGNRFGIEWGASKPRKRTSESTWKQPLRWNRQALLAQNEWFRLINKFGSEKRLFELGFVKPHRPRVFCASLADVFDNEVPDEWRADLFELIRKTPHLDWLILTKRIGNVSAMIAKAVGNLPRDEHCGTGQWNHTPIAQWPWPNVWLGATICNQEEADRDIPKLLATPAAKRFVSIEPMLGVIDLQGGKHSAAYRFYLREPFFGGSEFIEPKIDWVIVGGESGKNARPMHPDWVRSLRDQCANTGVPFLFKQWGEFLPYCQKNINVHPQLKGNVSVQSSRVGKNKAGRLLDGILHSEYPRENYERN